MKLASRLLEPPSRPDPSALAAALGIPATVPDVEIVRDGERVAWTMPDGLKIAGRWRAPAGEPRGIALSVADGARDVDVLLQAGWAVVEADPRGLGKLATGKPGWTYAVSLLLGENFTGRQALDLAAGLRGLSKLGKPVALVGEGPTASFAALYAAVLEPKAAWLATRGGFGSYRAFVERPGSAPASFTLNGPVDREIPAALVVFDVFRRFDVPDLYASLEPRRWLAADPIDGDFGRSGEKADFAARLKALTSP